MKHDDCGAGERITKGFIRIDQRQIKLIDSQRVWIFEIKIDEGGGFKEKSASFILSVKSRQVSDDA